MGDKTNPIFLVGTHADQVTPEHVAEIFAAAEHKWVGRIGLRKSLLERGHFFAVSCENRKGARELIQKVRIFFFLYVSLKR